MKKMIKAAVCLGAGAVLLAGGGGTLALWNASVAAKPGVIYSGNLGLSSPLPGVWTDKNGNVVSDAAGRLGSFEAVPGDVLRHTQTLEVALEGDNISATLAPVSAASGWGMDGADVRVSGPVLTDGSGSPLPALLRSSQTVTAQVTFEFLDTTTGTAGANSTYSLDNITYKLQQVIAD